MLLTQPKPQPYLLQMTHNKQDRTYRVENTINSSVHKDIFNIRFIVTIKQKI